MAGTSITGRQRHKELVEPQDLRWIKDLGRGSFGTVRQAYLHQKEVAVKYLEPLHLREASQETLEDRFDELKNLRHPHVALVIAHGTGCTGSPFIVTELAQHGSLLDFMTNKPNLHVRRRVDLAVEVAQGMLFLHSSNPVVLHLDLKPENVLVCSGEVAKVTDFGLSKILDESTMNENVPPGTYCYAAPESFDYDAHLAEHNPAERERLLKMRDVFSFGLLLHYLFTGRVPFQAEYDAWQGRHPGLGGRSYQFVQYRQFRNEFLQQEVPIPPLPPALPGAIADLIRRCCAKDPAARLSFDLIVERLKDLQELLAIPSSALPGPHHAPAQQAAVPPLPLPEAAVPPLPLPEAAVPPLPLPEAAVPPQPLPTTAAHHQATTQHCPLQLLPPSSLAAVAPLPLPATGAVPGQRQRGNPPKLDTTAQEAIANAPPCCATSSSSSASTSTTTSSSTTTTPTLSAPSTPPGADSHHLAATHSDQSEAPTTHARHGPSDPPDAQSPSDPATSAPLAAPPAHTPPSTSAEWMQSTARSTQPPPSSQQHQPPGSSDPPVTQPPCPTTHPPPTTPQQATDPPSTSHPSPSSPQHANPAPSSLSHPFHPRLPTTSSTALQPPPSPTHHPPPTFPPSHRPPLPDFSTAGVAAFQLHNPFLAPPAAALLFSQVPESITSELWRAIDPTKTRRAFPLPDLLHTLESRSSTFPSARWLLALLRAKYPLHNPSATPTTSAFPTTTFAPLHHTTQQHGWLEPAAAGGFGAHGGLSSPEVLTVPQLVVEIAPMFAGWAEHDTSSLDIIALSITTIDWLLVAYAMVPHDAAHTVGCEELRGQLLRSVEGVEAGERDVVLTAVAACGSGGRVLMSDVVARLQQTTRGRPTVPRAGDVVQRHLQAGGVQCPTCQLLVVQREAFWQQLWLDLEPELEHLEEQRERMGPRYPEAMFLPPVMVDEATKRRMLAVMKKYWVLWDDIEKHLSKGLLDERFFREDLRWVGRGKRYRHLVEPLDICNWYMLNKNSDYTLPSQDPYGQVGYHYADGIANEVHDENGRRPRRYILLQRMELQHFHSAESTLDLARSFKARFGNRRWQDCVPVAAARPRGLLARPAVLLAVVPILLALLPILCALVMTRWW